LGREKSGTPWEILYLVARSKSFRTAKDIEDQEARSGNKRYEVMVVSESDYDKNIFRKLRPPSGYDFTVPSSLPEPKSGHKPSLPETTPEEIKPHKNLGLFA